MSSADCDFQLDSETEKFISALSNSEWGDLSGETVMDVGCGNGSKSSLAVVHRFPKVRKIIAIDANPYRISEAKANNSHAKIEYYSADITNRRSLRRHKGVTKIISIRCMTYIDNHKQAFANMLRILKPGGHMALYFTLYSGYHAVTNELLDHPRWKQYFGDLSFNATTHNKKLTASYFSELLKDVGFEVIFCKEEDLKFPYDADEEPIEGIKKSPLFSRIPEELKDAYIEDAFSSFERCNCRTAEGQLCITCVDLAALVRKPK